jgi:hypothetical protein
MIGLIIGLCRDEIGVNSAPCGRKMNLKEEGVHCRLSSFFDGLTNFLKR